MKALLGDSLNDEEYAQSFSLLYHYIDLSNEQVFLRQQGRISKATWENWCDGIKSNLSLHTFSRAWQDIKPAAKDSFRELRKLEASGFQDDPYGWGKKVLTGRVAPR